MMTTLDTTAKVEFYLHHSPDMFALRRLYHIPRVGDVCVFGDVGRHVKGVTWCLDEDATERGVKVQITLDDG